MPEATSPTLLIDEAEPPVNTRDGGGLPVVSDGAPITALQEAILMVMCAYDTFPSKKDIARKLNISYSTVSRVITSPDFQALYKKIVLATAAVRFREVVEKNAEFAAAGSIEHVKVYLKLQGVLYDKVLDRTPPKSTSENAAALENRKKELMERLKEQARSEVIAEMKSAPEAAFTEQK